MIDPASRARLAPLARVGVIVTLAVAAACGTQEQGDRAASDTSPAREGQAQRSTTGVAPGTLSDSARRALAAESTAAALDQWNVAEIALRLTQAGLVVQDEGKTVHHPGLSIPGTVLDVSGSEFQAFVYPNQDARERDGVDLDTTNAGKAGIGQPLRPYFIITNNLIALHYTLSGRMAERVSDALMARHLGRR